MQPVFKNMLAYFALASGFSKCDAVKENDSSWKRTKRIKYLFTFAMVD